MAHNFLAAASLALFSTTTNLHAQEFRPLSELMDQAVRQYPSARCAGLYYSLILWAGEERLGPEIFSVMQRSIDVLTLHSTLETIEGDLGTDPEIATEAALRDINNIADRYIARFENNYALRGEAFNGDPLVTGDIETCQIWTQDITALLAEILD